MRSAILNVAGGGPYPRWQQRLRTSLVSVGWGDDCLFWTDEPPPGAPPHAEIPYAFKPHAFRVARERGYDCALWIDSAAICVRPLAPLLEHVATEGHLIYRSAWHVGQWTTDAALEQLGLSRDQAMEIPDTWACVLALDFRREHANAFLDEWLRFADDGVTFPGPWSNVSGEASSDPRCLGHRHDQCVSAVICHRLGIERTPWEPPRFFAYANMLLNDSVCIVNTRV